MDELLKYKAKTTLFIEVFLYSLLLFEICNIISWLITRSEIKL